MHPEEESGETDGEHQDDRACDDSSPGASRVKVQYEDVREHPIGDERSHGVPAGKAPTLFRKERRVPDRPRTAEGELESHIQEGPADESPDPTDQQSAPVLPQKHDTDHNTVLPP